MNFLNTQTIKKQLYLLIGSLCAVAAHSRTSLNTASETQADVTVLPNDTVNDDEIALLKTQIDCDAVNDEQLEQLKEELLLKVCPDGFYQKRGFRVMSHDRAGPKG